MMSRRDWLGALSDLVAIGIWVGLLGAFVVYVLMETTF